MNTLNLLSALVANLEAAHRIASELESAAQVDAGKKHFDALGSIVEAIKASSPVETKTDATEATEASAPVDATPKTTLEIVNELLNDPRYTLRTASSVIEKSGFAGDAEDLADYLGDNDIDVVIKHRRSDGAALIGLADRN